MSKKKVIFSLSPEIVGNATTGVLLGEFNDWDQNLGLALKKAKDGSLSTAVSLEAGQTYQYRYLLNDGRWVNDGNADEYTFKLDYQVDNCVIKVPATISKKVISAKKTPAAKKATLKKVAADDLSKIDGIGKKIAEILVKEGLSSYALLAKATQKTLKGILLAAGPRYKSHDPKTWAKQAKLASAGKWDELKKLKA